MNHLVPCPACRRHVRARETACPFCGDALALQASPAPLLPRSRLGRAALFAFGASVAVAAAANCGGDDTSSTTGSGGSGGGSTSTSAGGSTSTSAGGSSATGGAAGASGSGGASTAGSGGTGGATPPPDGGADAADADSGGPFPLYGAPPP